MPFKSKEGDPLLEGVSTRDDDCDKLNSGVSSENVGCDVDVSDVKLVPKTWEFKISPRVGCTTDVEGGTGGGDRSMRGGSGIKGVVVTVGPKSH